jgi:hypothetical protein
MTDPDLIGNEPPTQEPVEPEYQGPDVTGGNLLGGAEPWTCVYAATMDNDWHNDVLCTDGLRSERPQLRPRDSFVTHAEIMRAARRHENALNRGLFTSR